jgi:hypothetical protein
LIPKGIKSPGFRDLGLFPGLTRVGVRSRVDECRKFERAHDRPFFAAGEGRAATDVVWRAAVRAEAAVGAGLEAATVIQDITAFFQHVRHDLLLRRCEVLGFPLWMARLAIHLYRSPRRLTMFGAVGEEVVPNRGIPPGCAWAMTLVKIYYLAAFDALVLQHPAVEISVYVDDLQFSAVGKAAQVISRIHDAVVDSQILVEDRLKSEFARHKASASLPSAQPPEEYVEF